MPQFCEYANWCRYRFVSEEDQAKALQKQQQQAEVAAQLEAQVASRKREKEMEQQRLMEMEKEEESKILRHQEGQYNFFSHLRSREEAVAQSLRLQS